LAGKARGAADRGRPDRGPARHCTAAPRPVRDQVPAGGGRRGGCPVNNLAIQALVATFAAGKAIVDEQAARAAVTEYTDT